jgi:hypothetical protein
MRCAAESYFGGDGILQLTLSTLLLGNEDRIFHTDPSRRHTDMGTIGESIPLSNYLTL